MKFTIAASLIASAAAFAPASVSKSSSSLSAFSKESLPGAIAPTGLFDPLGFLEKADDATALRYREAEVTHGRVSMLAVIGFLVGEKVEGSSFLFDSQISGPAITHFFQVPDFFWTVLVGFIGALELNRAQLAFVSPAELGPDEAGKMRADHYPGDIGFDPLGLKPEDAEEFDIMATKELQHGRLAMLAAAGFLAQEAVDGKGILEHVGF
eukprot:CAMPEP_0116024182 /NCGR_PEP_ID=MMETSP0321-20121206/12144_1 /TAXON_ID=163516 /ORGANISM="Leptocylindrus danicus var. danicus, Strain B650" /LENGTH=209 /DNA_ID=CAMNT_0003495823 /DNA_START=38 /DNA_END=667 /DNA_ORIENTATION=+